MNRYRLGVLSLGVTAALTLGACADMQKLFGGKAKTPAKPVAAKTQTYDAASFVEHLSVARLTLENGGTASDIADDAKVIEAFTKQKKAKSTIVTLAVLDYSGAGKHALAPVGEGKNMTQLTNVLAVMGAKPYKLKDVHVMAVSIAPGVPMKITGQDADAAREAISARHEAIAGSAHKVAPLKEAKLQLKLLRYFMNAQHRDAAYICADNTKRLLSSAPAEGAAREEIDALAKELEATEGELRRTMPY